MQETKIADAPEPWPGFDDTMSIWMALVTERERLRHVVETRQLSEPMFGPPEKTRALTDAEVFVVEKKLARVCELVELSMARRRELAAALLGLA
jgi:hypothetical protein